MSGPEGRAVSEGLKVIYGKALDERLTHHNAVLLDCLTQTIAALKWKATDNCHQTLRNVARRMIAAGMGNEVGQVKVGVETIIRSLERSEEKEAEKP